MISTSVREPDFIARVPNPDFWHFSALVRKKCMKNTVFPTSAKKCVKHYFSGCGGEGSRGRGNRHGGWLGIFCTVDEGRRERDRAERT